MVEETVEKLPAKAVQLQCCSQHGDSNSGPHVQIFALCSDGSIWVQYSSSGYSNVPTDGHWREVEPKYVHPCEVAGKDMEDPASELLQLKLKVARQEGEQIRALKRLGPFPRNVGEDPDPMDCTLAGRVSEFFGIGMTSAIEKCRMAGEDPHYQEPNE